MSFFVLILCILNTSAKMPTVTLQNAAQPHTEIPVVRLGTGGYTAAKSPEATPEHWNATEGYINTIKWFNIGGRGVDTANTYQSFPGVASGLLNITNNWTTINRKDVWITSKTGPPLPLGYNDTINQWRNIIDLLNTTYVDIIYIHWPSDNSTNSYKSTDYYCNASDTRYNPKTCRQNTWKAYEYIFNIGGARAIGVSNFEINHLQDIFELNSLIPAVNNIEFHGYWHEYELVNYCQSFNILINSYAPLGTPDVTYGDWTGNTPILTQHPVAIQVANRYNKTAPQVWLKWALQQNIVVNPRSWNVTHQEQNMDIFDFMLNEEDMLYLSSIQPPNDPKICPNPQTYA